MNINIHFHIPYNMNNYKEPKEQFFLRTLLKVEKHAFNYYTQQKVYRGSVLVSQDCYNKLMEITGCLKTMEIYSLTVLKFICQHSWLFREILRNLFHASLPPSDGCWQSLEFLALFLSLQSQPPSSPATLPVSSVSIFLLSDKAAIFNLFFI